MISICKKVRLQQLGKTKYSILASILHIFQKVSLQSFTSVCTIQCVNLMIFFYFNLNLDTFFKIFLKLLLRKPFLKVNVHISFLFKHKHEGSIYFLVGQTKVAENFFSINNLVVQLHFKCHPLKFLKIV